MLRHVSQHDLPLSVQEMQKLNNRRMAIHSSGLRPTRELRVNVFPTRRIPRSINTTTCHSVKNSRKESILNHQDNNDNSNDECNDNNGNSIEFIREMNRECINASTDSEPTVNNEIEEDEMNNNAAEMKRELKDSNTYSEPIEDSEREEDSNNSRDKQLQCSLPEIIEKLKSCKSTQTNLAVTPGSRIVKYKQSLDREIQIQNNEADGVNRSSIITRDKKLKRKSLSKLNLKKCGRKANYDSRLYLPSLSDVKCAKPRIARYKLQKNSLKEENKNSTGITYLLKDVCLPLLPYLPLISVSFLIASCAASNMYSLLIEPNFMYLAKKYKFFPPKSDAGVNEIIPFFTKIMKYIYDYIRDIR